jgi:hypothetical protein
LVENLNLNEFYVAASPSLAGACTAGGVPGYIFGIIDNFEQPASVSPYGVSASHIPPPSTANSPETHFAGNDIVIFGSIGCNSGSYPIVVTEDSGAKRSFVANFTISA